MSAAAPSAAISLRQLRAFATVAELGSFSRAAEQLSLTPSALSVLVRELERALGVRLFDRHTRRVQLSEAGAEFRPRVQRVFAELEEGVAGLGQLRDRRRGLLRVAAPQLMACTLMPEMLAAYRAAFPDIEVRLHDAVPERLLESLARGDSEIAIGPEGAPVAGVQSRPLMRDRHWLICRPDHPLARSRRKLRWRDLERFDFIAPTRDFQLRLQPELQGFEPGWRLGAAHAVTYMTTALGMVAQGLGVSACPSYAAPLVKAHGLVMRLLNDPVFYREINLYSLAGKALSPAAHSFVDFIERSEPLRSLRRTAGG